MVSHFHPTRTYIGMEKPVQLKVSFCQPKKIEGAKAFIQTKPVNNLKAESNEYNNLNTHACTCMSFNKDVTLSKIDKLAKTFQRLC